MGGQFLVMAVEMEKVGAAFYDALAQRVKAKDVKAAFSQLAGWEKKHEDVFRDLMVRIGDHALPKSLSKDTYEYIRRLADSTMFTCDLAKRLTANKPRTDIEATEVGINIEEDSILLYSEIRGMLPHADQDIIDAIISEEKKHLSEITYITNQLRSGA